jgi:phage-related protein
MGLGGDSTIGSGAGGGVLSTFDKTFDEVSSTIDEAINEVSSTIDEAINEVSSTFDKTLIEVSSTFDKTLIEISSTFAVLFASGLSKHEDNSFVSFNGTESDIIL